MSTPRELNENEQEQTNGGGLLGGNDSMSEGGLTGSLNIDNLASGSSSSSDGDESQSSSFSVGNGIGGSGLGGGSSSND